MSNSNYMLAGIGTANAGLEGYSAYSQAQALREHGIIAERAGAANAKFAEAQAQDAIDRGEVSAARSGIATNKVIGAQRAALAAQGVSVDTGSALDAQVESGNLGAQDALAIRDNAFREALGYKVQGNNYITQGKLQAAAMNNESANTLLSGGLRAGTSLAGAGVYYSKGREDSAAKDRAGFYKRAGQGAGSSEASAYNNRVR